MFDEESKRYNILRPKDSDKDQTYALWGLSQEALSKTLFPLGELTKPEVRTLAAKFGLKTASKEDSYEICFVADNDYRRFLHERLPQFEKQITEGDIVLDDKVVGKHKGFPYYTIGQRSGLGAYGEKVYVTDIDAETNTVKIGRGNDLLRRELIARDVNLIGVEAIYGSFKVQAQVRYKDTPSPATVNAEADNKVRIVFDEPKRAITPGQSVVMYDGGKMLGGGVIERIVQ
jgi:tRNA-specific 2-thiouridylase